MSAALGDREVRVIAHSFHKYQTHDRKKYKLMDAFCQEYGLAPRSSEQYKYLIEKKAVTRDAIAKEDKWDSDVEAASNRDRKTAHGVGAAPVPIVKTENAADGSDLSTLEHRKKCRDLLVAQNTHLASIAKSLYM